ncbi:hypothetical protein D4764_0276290 [Takifugu flavidus]|uniref:Pyrin domain-containing protein n=1 Tax=Takifugu flavidus TaxID=433684 RepID=A0A5C6MFQ8_9TELE|nr:hypothetical protein D4764_0276290 [Takifugu flavidus]
MSRRDRPTVDPDRPVDRDRRNEPPCSKEKTDATMAQEILLNVLEHLTEDEFDKFNFYLKDPGVMGGFNPIKEGQIDNKKRTVVVDLMVKAYKDQGAVEVTKKILEKIPRNDILQNLSAVSSDPTGPTCEHVPIGSYQSKLQSNLRSKFMCVQEGCDEKADEQRLDDVYTQLYVTTGGDIHINAQHEVTQIDMKSSPLRSTLDNTRPAAANQIHPDFVDMRTEVFEDVLKMREELPKTLTAMYIYFLDVQSTQKNKRGRGKAPQWSPESCEMIPILAKLAFEQLQKGNVIFYESDLRDCGITVRSADAYSGVFTQMFRRERGLFKEEVFCFVHLSVQEFLAALHAHLTFTKLIFYQCAVDEALQNEKDTWTSVPSPAVPLGSFSLPTNQALLRGLINGEGSSEPNQEIIGYIKEKTGENLSSERIINLFHHCLSELNDSSLVQEVQRTSDPED